MIKQLIPDKVAGNSAMLFLILAVLKGIVDF
jgi:hypothetical protein